MTKSAALEELLSHSKPISASDEGQLAELFQLIAFSVEKLAVNDIGNGHCALSRAMAMSSLMMDKAQAECWKSDEHAALAKRCDDKIAEVVTKALPTSVASSYYMAHRPFPMVLTKEQERNVQKADMAKLKATAQA